MKKVLLFSFFLVIGFAGAFAQEQNDSLKKVAEDTASAYSRLDARQIYDLERMKIDAHTDKTWDQKAEMIVPIAGFLSAIIMLLIFTIFSYKVKQRRNEVFLKYAELGKDIPKEFLEGNLDRKTNTKLGKAILLISFGIGLLVWVFTGFLGGHEKIFIGGGIISLFLGIGYLIIHFIEKKQKQNDEPGR
jgi:hypothetical protein